MREEGCDEGTLPICRDPTTFSRCFGWSGVSVETDATTHRSTNLMLTLTPPKAHRPPISQRPVGPARHLRWTKATYWVVRFYTLFFFYQKILLCLSSGWWVPTFSSSIDDYWGKTKVTTPILFTLRGKSKGTCPKVRKKKFLTSTTTTIVRLYIYIHA